MTTFDKKNITLLCKVVDNFGDIGFVYRLARALSEQDASLRLRLVVSDLASFAALAPHIDATKTVQSCYGWQIFDWNAAAVCTQAFSAEPPAVILECFQCGRPDWLESILFDTNRATPQAAESVVHIINIDYLTAEDYADDFHCLKSGTRSARVKKINFMPGFTKKTGGLILDSAFLASKKNADQAQCNALADAPVDFTVVFFSYERDCTPLVQALAQFQAATDKTVRVLVAAGKSQQPFLSAWERAEKPFAVTALDFLPQEHWDALLCRADCTFVRGEDSLSRACLAGKPFVWQAYPQDENYHLVKLQALYERLKPFLPEHAAAMYQRATQAYNTNDETAAMLLDFFSAVPSLNKGFADFAAELIAHGDLAAHLLQWLEGLRI